MTTDETGTGTGTTAPDDEDPAGEGPAIVEITGDVGTGPRPDLTPRRAMIDRTQ